MTPEYLRECAAVLQAISYYRPLVEWMKSQADAMEAAATPTAECENKKCVHATAAWLDADELLVDPPSGWRFGFPKVWNRKTHPDMRAWLVENGYPQKEANQAELVCRFISMEER